MTAIDKAREAVPHGAIEALANNQRQLDIDGCEVGVSRQAIDEVLAWVSAALSALDQPSGVRMGRDEIANIIDPHSFIDIPFTDDPVLLDMVEQSKQDALRKADRILSALDLSAIGADGWKDISTCPKDGSHFLARQVVIADEYDEDDRIIRKGVREEFTVVAYWVFGGVVQFPWNGGMPSNVTYILWRPLPSPLETRS